MAIEARRSSRAKGEHSRATTQRRLLAPGDIAWLAAPPCALVLLAAIAALGPALGALLFPPGEAFDPVTMQHWAKPILHPEPTEHARYLIALLLPLAIAAAVVALARRPLAIERRAVAWIARGAQLATVALLAAAIVAQRSVTYETVEQAGAFRRAYFTPPALLVAAAIAAGLAALAVRGWARRAWAWCAETRAKGAAAAVAALLLTAAWLLTGLNTEGSIGMAHPVVQANMPFWLEETFAVLDGRAPLVDFHAQYGQLWPYLAAGTMSLLGASLGVYAATMVVGAGLALLAIFATLRRIVGRSLPALALYAPFLATSLFAERGPLENRYGPSDAFSLFPMRYAGPYLLAWLTVRHLGGVRPRRAWPLFLVAGLALVNNVEFGLPALGATVAALLWTSGRLTRRLATRLLAEAGLGLAAALALTTALVLAVSGSPPRLGMLLEFPRLYGIEGFGMLPMPAFGLHLVVYATFVAALVLATVRAVGSAEERPLTGMLAWAGVFGLGAGSYFVGRSHPEVLVDLFSAWALALVLLGVVALQELAARGAPRPTIPQLAVLFGFGLAICSLAQTPAPWRQLDRIGEQAAQRRLVPRYMRLLLEQSTKPGEHVLVVGELGHRAAYEAGVLDVAPYADILSMPAVRQLRTLVEAGRREGVRKLFYDDADMADEYFLYLKRSGYRIAGYDERLGLGVMMVRPSRRPSRPG